MEFKAHIHAVNASSMYSAEIGANNPNSRLLINSNCWMTNLSVLLKLEHYTTRLFSEPENHSGNFQTVRCYNSAGQQSVCTQVGHS